MPKASAAALKQRGASSIREIMLGKAPGQGIIASKGLDKLYVPPRAWADGRNVRFTNNGTKARKTDGYTLFDTTTGNIPIRAIFGYQPLTGGKVLVRIGTTNAYSNSGVALTNIAAGLTGGVDDVVSIDQWRDILVWTDRKDVPKKWTGAGAAANLGGAPAKAKVLLVHKGTLHLYNVIDPGTGTDQPWKSWYSAIDNFEDWTGPLAGDLDFLETPGGIIGAVPQGDDIVVYKAEGAHREQFTGGTFPWIENPIPWNDGLIAARAAVRKGPYHYLMGNKDFWRMGAYPESIGNRAVQAVVEALVDRSRKHLIFGYERANYDEIVWKVPTPLSQSGAPYFDIVYNTRDGTWSFNDHAPGYSFGSLELSVIDDWDNGEDADWNTGLDIEWDWSQSYGNALELLGQADGKLQSFGSGAVDANGAVISAYLESGYANPQELRPCRLLTVPIVGRGVGDLTVKTKSLKDERGESGVVFSDGTLFPLGAYGGNKPWASARGFGRLFQVRFEQAVLGGDFEIDAWGLGIVPSDGTR